MGMGQAAWYHIQAGTPKECHAWVIVSSGFCISCMHAAMLEDACWLLVNSLSFVGCQALPSLG